MVSVTVHSWLAWNSICNIATCLCPMSAGLKACPTTSGFIVFFLKDVFYFFNCAYACVSELGFVHCVYSYLWKTGESVGSFGAGVKRGCELPVVGSGARTAVLWKSSQHS